jgi:aerobic C4-dicarboxylate transport protein
MLFKKLIKSLYFQVLVAILIGVLLGHFYSSFAIQLKPLGDGFIQLVKMIIAPIIFLTVVSGIVGMKDKKTIAKTGGYALIYFEILSTLGLIVGLIIVNWLKPGVGMNVDVSQLDANSIATYTVSSHQYTVTGFLLNIIPNTFVSAFTEGNILQVLLISLLFGFGLHALGERGKSIADSVHKISSIFFYIVNVIMKLAPLGALGAMAFTVGQYGWGTLFSLGKLMGTFYITCLIFIFGILGTIAFFHGFNIWKFIKYIKEELLIVLSTSSSESALPRMIAKMENLGVKQSVVGLVIPAGYSFNLDGTSIYLSMAVVFIAQATNTPLDISHQIILLVVLLLTSKGAAGVTGSGFITLAATLSSVGYIPVEGLALILGIDRFMSEARSLTNLIGNGVATIVVGKWCKQVNEKQLQTHLDHGTFNEANNSELIEIK